MPHRDRRWIRWVTRPCSASAHHHDAAATSVAWSAPSVASYAASAVDILFCRGPVVASSRGKRKRGDMEGGQPRTGMSAWPATLGRGCSVRDRRANRVLPPNSGRIPSTSSAAARAATSPTSGRSSQYLRCSGVARLLRCLLSGLLCGFSGCHWTGGGAHAHAM